MSMISKQQFDQLVQNTTKYLTEHGQQIAKLQRQNVELSERLLKIETRRKPGPKPKAKAKESE